MVEGFADVEHEADDQLRHVVAGRRLPCEDHRARHADAARIVLEAVVAGDHLQHVQKLALVFVEALHLGVEQAVGIDGDAAGLADQLRQPLLVAALDLAEAVVEAAIVGELREPLELVEVLFPAFADARGDQVGERRVGLEQPAARRDAVGHVDELVRPDFREVGKQALAQQLGVERGDAVDLVAADHREVRHADAPRRVVHQRDAGQDRRVAREHPPHVAKEGVVDFVDDFEVARQDRLDHVHRPGFERLGQQGVVGVAEGALGEPPRGLEAHPVVVHEQAHQLRHRHRRMGVVELDRHLLGEAGEVVVVAQVAVQDVLQRGGNEEVLLLQPQFLAVLALVVGVENLRESLGKGLAAHRLNVVALVEGVEVELPRRPRRPQAQVPHRRRREARNRVVEGHRHDFLGIDPLADLVALRIAEAEILAAEAHPIEHRGARHLPRIAEAQPVFRLLDLLALLDALGEHAVFVADAVADARIVVGEQAVEEAGGEAPEAAVAERGVGLVGLDLVEVEAERGERLAGHVHHAEVVEHLLQRTADQVFHRKVVDQLLALVVVLP